VNLTFRRLGVSELLPRYIFAESLFVRRRVLEVGAVAATGGASAEFLVARGARVVVACDDDLAAVEAAQARAGSAHLRFRPAIFDDLPPGGFDLVLVADLAPYVLAPELLRQLADQVSSTGVLVGGIRNPAGLSLAQLMEAEGEGAPPTYGQVLDALGAHFPHVETATQSPLLGYQLAFDRSEGLQVDGSLAGSGEAAYFVVLASRERLRAVDPTWVQLPPAPLAFTGGRLDAATTKAREWEERARRLKTSLGEAREQLSRAAGDLEVTRAALEKSRDEAVAIQAEAEVRGQAALHPVVQDELATKMRRLESEVQQTTERAIAAERKLAARTADAEAARAQERQQEAEVLAAQESVRLERARREELQRQVDDARAKLTAAYDELRGVREDLTRARTDGERGRLSAEARGSEGQLLEERLAQARERELRLAEQHSLALTALEGVRVEVAQARSRAEAYEQRVGWLEAERAKADRAAEADRARFEEQLLALKNAPPVVDSGELEGLRTELVALQGERGRLGDRVAVLEGQEQAARTLAAALETRLAASEAARAEAEAAAQPGGPSPEALAQARSALEEALDSAQQARAERERDVAALEAAMAARAEELGAARAALEQAQERGSITANFAREAVARAERAEQETVAQTRRVEELQHAFAALELEARASGQSLEARAAADAELRAAHAAQTAQWEEALTASRRQLEEAEQALAAAREQAAELVPRLEVAEAARQAGAGRLASLEEAHHELIAQRDALRDASRSGAESQAVLTAQITALEASAAEAHAGRREAEEGLQLTQAAQAEAVLAWEAQVATLEAEQHHTAAALAEATEALARAEALVGEMASLRSELAESTAQSAAFREALDESRQRSDALAVALEQAAAAADAERAQAEADLQAARESLAALEAQHREVSERLAAQESAAPPSEDQARAAKTAREQLQVELAQERARLRVLEEERDEADSRVAELEEQSSRASEELASVQFERDALAAQAEQAAAREQVVLQELDQARTQVAPGAIQQMLAEAVAARDALLEERSREREWLGRLEREHAALASFAERAQGELDARDEVVRQSEGQLAEAQAELESSRAQLEALTTRVDQLQRRLAAQEGELLVLRRAAARRGPGGGDGGG
jgi:golgin subfamily B member 1